MIELRDDVEVPEGFEASVAPGQQVLVAVEATGGGTRPVGAVVARFGDGVARLPRVWISPDAHRVEADLVAALRRATSSSAARA